MRTDRRALAVIALAALIAPGGAHAWVVVRAPVYVAPRPVVVVAPAPVYVAPAPVYLPSPAPVPDPLTTRLAINTTMWTLPAGCNPMSVGGQAYFQCGVNWMKAFTSSTGTYYGVVAAP